MEPDDACTHYTEQLALLPGIGTRFAKGELPARRGRDAYSLPRGPTLLLCPQSLFKIHPANDEIFARILAANPHSKLVLFAGRHPAITDRFMRRLERCLDEHGLPIRERTLVLPQMPHADYLAVNLECDAMLDTVRWSEGRPASTPYVALSLWSSAWRADARPSKCWHARTARDAGTDRYRY